MKSGGRFRAKSAKKNGVPAVGDVAFFFARSAGLARHAAFIR